MLSAQVPWITSRHDEARPSPELRYAYRLELIVNFEIFPCDTPTVIKLPCSKEQQSQNYVLSLHISYCKMATVYKSLSKVNGSKDEETTAKGPRKNKQRVLILSSRGVTYR